MTEEKINQNHHSPVFCNSDDPIPEVFYIFTNMLDWMTRHNLTFTKGFTSGSIGEIAASEDLRRKYFDGTINYYPFVPNETPDVYGLSRYAAGATSDYRIEYSCEGYRRTHEAIKLFPSRLSALYAFGDYADCEEVARKYGWQLDSVKKFKLLSIPYSRVAKVNMEVISLMRRAERQGSWDQEEQEKIWHHYWSGAGSLDLEIPTDGVNKEKVSSGVIWEYLIEGRVELIED